jgi:hypothetical protein
MLRRTVQRYHRTLLALALLALAGSASALSTAPLLALNSYIEQDGRCPEQLLDWNRKYNPQTVAGESPRTFYYRVLAYSDWGACGQPWFKPLFSELQKIWLIHAQGLVSDTEVESKENELINLFFSALANHNGDELIHRYETVTTTRLMNLVPEKQFFNCTFFGKQARCTQ